MTNTTPGDGNREAHVQVLTAEVRTLVVGSRQVTMSVYNQLDAVPPGSIEPFGRVNPKDANEKWMFVVGRHVASGVLVRSSVHRLPESLEDWHWESLKNAFDGFGGLTRQELSAVVEQWSALPLIVLAGLR